MDDPQRKARRRFRRLSASLDPMPIEDTGAHKRLKYETDGQFDYDLYKNVQTLGNKMKLGKQWVPEDHIKILSTYLVNHNISVETGICHGTRQGFEQQWFAQSLPGHPNVIGTEISDTATRFPNTIQWDFHDVKPEWLSKIDFIYSNSWDHSYDPEKAFGAWISCLRPGGVMFLDHGWNFKPGRVDLLDAFGISEAGLIDMLGALFSDFGLVTEVIEGGMHKRHPIRTVVFTAHTNEQT